VYSPIFAAIFAVFRLKKIKKNSMAFFFLTAFAGYGFKRIDGNI